MFKSDYMLQLKEASADSSMGTLESFGEKALFVEQQSKSRQTVRVEAVEWLSHALMLNMGGDA